MDGGRQESAAPSRAAAAALAWLSDVETFSRAVVRRPLRAYQLEPARAIIESILSGSGHTL